MALCEHNPKLSFGSISGTGTENNHKFIIGENYDALKNLVCTYTKNGEGLIDVIYIDPPYNTEKAKEDGNDYKEEVKAEKFIYRDKFTRTGWLNMMRERLYLARKLLSPKGVIFISIDDREQAYLKVLCDEIFGENNFVGIINCLDNLKGKENDTYLSYTSHYILTYAKQKRDDLGFNSVPTTETIEEGYPYIDSCGNLFNKNSFKKTGASKKREDRPFMFYPVLIQDNTIKLPEEKEYKSLYCSSKKQFKDDELKKIIKKYEELGYEVILPKDKNSNYLRWTSSFDTCKKLIANGDLIYENGTISQKKYPTEIELIKQSCYGTPKNFIYKEDFANATNDLNKLGIDFSNPKSVSLIKYLISLVKSSNPCIILDFFAGSGTTGQAVMELNEEDGGNRRCILVTNNENGIAKNVAYERLYRVVMGNGTKGEKFQWQYSKEKPCLTNNYWDVFEIKQYELKIDDYEKAQELIKKAENEFKLLNPDYVHKEFDIYNQLASLRPFSKGGK